MPGERYSWTCDRAADTVRSRQSSVVTSRPALMAPKLGDLDTNRSRPLSSLARSNFEGLVRVDGIIVVSISAKRDSRNILISDDINLRPIADSFVSLQKLFPRRLQPRQLRRRCVWRHHPWRRCRALAAARARQVVRLGLAAPPQGWGRRMDRRSRRTRYHSS